MSIRPATPDDADAIAAIHVQCWQETYPGLLPESEIARRDLPYRQALWRRILADVRGCVWYAPDCGFAHAGPQRDAPLAAAGFGFELYSFYLLRVAHGSGLASAMLSACLDHDSAPMTALVLEDNARACRFYQKSGGQHLETRDDAVGDAPIRERVYGWRVAAAQARETPPGHHQA